MQSRRERLSWVEAAEVGRPRFRHRNPIVSGQLYQFRQPIWDFYGVTVATALNLQRLFQIPRGQQYTPTGGAALTKTLWHTSMDQAGVLPSPDKFFAKAISVSITSNTAVGDAERFLDDTILRLIISDRSFLDAHAFKLPAAGGLYGFNAATVTNGIPDPMAQYQLSGPLGEVIEQLQNFAVELDPVQVVRANAAGIYTTLTTANGGFGINAHVYLDGLKSRAVL